MIWSGTTHAPDETRKLGFELGANLKGSEILCLYGDLGSGKTCFSQGVINAVHPDADPYPRSPTYSLVNRYEGETPLCHVDLYRLMNEEELYGIGFDELLHSGEILLIEWAEKLDTLKPDKRVDITLEYAGDSNRNITITPVDMELKLMRNG